MNFAISGVEIPMDPTAEHGPQREKLQRDRPGVIHKFVVAGYKGYIRTGLYEDGRLGEIFIKINKEGSTLSGVLGSFAVAVSIALQYGVPLEILAAKFVGSRFEPMGVTQNPEIREATSIVDYVFTWLMLRYGPKEKPVGPPEPPPAAPALKVVEAEEDKPDGES